MVDGQQTETHHALRQWSVGIDIGQASDPTAVCAIEVVRWQLADWFEQRWRMRAKGDPFGRRTGEWMTQEAEQIAKSKPAVEFRIRALQRLALGLSYVDQCGLLCAMLAKPELADADVFLDATGCGKPVSDLLRRGGLRHKPIWITGGQGHQQHEDGWSVAKIDLITRLQAALHAGELKVAKELKEAAAFTRELQEFRVTWTEAGHLRFGARQGAHDDLVLAAALAVYGATALRNTVTVQSLKVWG